MVLQEIKNRYSVRNFSKKEIPADVIKNILESGRLAPSWANSQPWHFIVIKDQQSKDLLAKLSHGQPHVAQAPVIIACCGDLSAWKKETFKKILMSRPGIDEERVNFLLDNPAFSPELKGMDAVIYRTTEELTYAVAYMTLEAEENNVGACVVGFVGNELTESLPDVYSQVRQKLGLPENIILVSLLLLGYPAQETPPFSKIRKEPEHVISYEKYGAQQ